MFINKYIFLLFDFYFICFRSCTPVSLPSFGKIRWNKRLRSRSTNIFYFSSLFIVLLLAIILVWCFGFKAHILSLIYPKLPSEDITQCHTQSKNFSSIHFHFFLLTFMLLLLYILLLYMLLTIPQYSSITFI